MGNISDEEMQDLWAKMLAGEINQPSSFSLRLIDILRNISAQEARLFQEMCFKAIQIGSNIFIPRYSEYMQEFDIIYSDIMRLDELGLMNSAGLLIIEIPINSSMRHLASNEALIIAAKSTDSYDKMLSINQYPFTSVGRELANLYGINSSDEQLTTFAKDLNNNGDVKVSLFRITGHDGAYIHYNGTDLLDVEYNNPQLVP